MQKPRVMRDLGVQRAIEAAGGIAALARKLGIRQPSVSEWTRVPAQRVAAVAHATGLDPAILRPDLFDQAASLRPTLRFGDVPAMKHDAIEQARAFEYLLLGKLLRQAPTPEMLAAIAKLNGDETPLGLAHATLAQAAADADPAAVADEFFALFVGVGRGEVLPYGSYYLTGFLHERPLARLRSDLTDLGIARAESNFDPEDQLGLLLEVMGGFANGTFPADLGRQKHFFERHLATWAVRCFADIAMAPSAKFYKAVAAVGGCFLDIEARAFELED